MKLDGEDYRFLSRVIIVCVIVFGAIFAVTNSAPFKQVETVNVSGEYTYKMVPDVIEFTMTFEETGKTSESVQEALMERSQGAFEAIKSWGGSSNMVSYNVYPVYSYDKGQQVPESFRGSMVVEVKLERNGGETLNDIMSKTSIGVGILLKEYGVDSISGIKFDVQDQAKEEAKLIALQKASEDAYKKALTIAKENNARIKVKEIYEEYYYSPYYDTKGVVESVSGGNYPRVEFYGEAEVTAKIRAVYTLY